jgi:uncharacterized protein YgfB (UPF0149 family)
MRGRFRREIRCMTQSPLDYAALRDTLASAGAVISLAELHGGVCGALCVGAVTTAQHWVVDCLRDDDLEPSADIGTALDEVILRSWRMLEDRELGFEPLLPSDDDAIDERVQALALWCHGFLSGLGANAPDIARQTPGKGATSEAATVGEILGDFAEISRAGLGEAEIEGGNEPDFALAELIEYVRVGVQIVFEDLTPRRGVAGSGPH